MSDYVITVDETKADFDGNCPISAKLEIVRCRDCKHADWLAVVGIGVLHCKYHGWTQTGNPDGFCAWAIKRGEI